MLFAISHTLYAISSPFREGDFPKGTDRSRLLREAGVSTDALTNMDWIDAALCALAAHHLVMGIVKPYGDVAEGFIVVPIAEDTFGLPMAESGD